MDSGKLIISKGWSKLYIIIWTKLGQWELEVKYVYGDYYWPAIVQRRGFACYCLESQKTNQWVLG